MQRALSLNNSPAASVPLRFMFSTPLFVLLAALLLLWAGPMAFVSRWTPQALALTHLFTLGALAHAMAGAMMQILPVATNIHILAPRLTATVVHIGLGLGTLALVAAFLVGTPWLYHAAVALLTIALLWLPVAVVGGWWRHRKNASKGSVEILAGVRFALAALLVTLIIGASLAGQLGASVTPNRLFTDLHATWGLLGWIGLLVIAMSFQLIPMFQVTELYPKIITRWLTPTIIVLLMAHTFTVMGWGSVDLDIIVQVLLVVAYLVFAGETLYLIWTRKRPEPDATTLFWRTSMTCLAACAPVWLAQLLTGTDMSVTLAMLFIVGFAWSAVNGMLYKIVPFLTWFHCQRGLQVALPFIPKVRQMIPDAKAKQQFVVHLLALVLLIAASLHVPYAARAGALALLVSAAWLLLHMLHALRLLVSTKQKIRETLGQTAQS
ncbi:hypothetical protein ACMHYO_10720 [Allopusillimonas ginsengisoli]|uniref:hypothetical protein n=1 Tax=Allopusillimonas ginsengisoli TaxID=453575 RepID=UPI0039C2B982